MVRCALCYNKFQQDESYYFMCYECASEYYMLGSEELSKALRAIFTLINAKLNMEEIKFIADSTSFDRFVTDMFEEKDHDTKVEWLLKRSKEML